MCLLVGWHTTIPSSLLFSSAHLVVVWLLCSRALNRLTVTHSTTQHSKQHRAQTKQEVSKWGLERENTYVRLYVRSSLVLHLKVLQQHFCQNDVKGGECRFNQTRPPQPMIRVHSDGRARSFSSVQATRLNAVWRSCAQL